MKNINSSKHKLNFTENKTNASEALGLFFNVWCKEIEYTQAKPWKIQQIVAQDMQTAAEMFVRDYDKRKNMFFAKNCSSQFNNSQCSGQMFVYVQDWRGIINKFEIEIKNQPMYYAKRIK